MNTESQKQENTSAKTVCRQKSVWFYLVTGIVLGVVLTAIAVWQLMPGMMIQVHESALSYDKTIEALEKAIARQGWSSPGTKDMNASLAKFDVNLEPRVNNVQLCKAPYAESVLRSDRHIACLMPCTISVWQGDDGKVYLSKMNTALMGKMFGGNIARVMGGAVSEDEHAILAGIIK